MTVTVSSVAMPIRNANDAPDAANDAAGHTPHYAANDAAYWPSRMVADPCAVFTAADDALRLYRHRRGQESERAGRQQGSHFHGRVSIVPHFERRPGSHVEQSRDGRSEGVNSLAYGAARKEAAEQRNDEKLRR